MLTVLRVVECLYAVTLHSIVCLSFKIDQWGRCESNGKDQRDCRWKEQYVGLRICCTSFGIRFLKIGYRKLLFAPKMLRFPKPRLTVFGKFLQSRDYEMA